MCVSKYSFSPNPVLWIIHTPLHRWQYNQSPLQTFCLWPRVRSEVPADSLDWMGLEMFSAHRDEYFCLLGHNAVSEEHRLHLQGWVKQTKSKTDHSRSRCKGREGPPLIHIQTKRNTKVKEVVSCSAYSVLKMEAMFLWNGVIPQHIALILTEVSRGFPWSCLGNAGVVSQLDCGCYLSNPFEFIRHQSS
jgi:hypothetical protein